MAPNYALREPDSQLQMLRGASAWSVQDLRLPERDKSLCSELGWYLASQSTYAEEAGLLIALRLGTEINDCATRRILGIQATEEAKHSHAFEYYAKWAKGYIGPPAESTENLLRELNKISDPLQLFCAHTFLEGFALDEFSMLAEAFKNEALGGLYTFVKADEAEHVSAGINYIKSVTPALSIKQRLRLQTWCEENIFKIAGVGEASYVALASISDVTASDVGSLFRHRFSRRCKQALSL